MYSRPIINIILMKEYDVNNSYVIRKSEKDELGSMGDLFDK